MSHQFSPISSSRGPLLLLHPNPIEALDLQRRPPALFRDLAVLLHDEAARGFVAVEAAEQLGGHAAVGALGAVFVDDVEKGELALRIGSGFFGHGGLSSISAPLSKQNAVV